jgi:hypothetical protein
MKILPRNDRIIFIAAGILLLSIILMVVIILVVLNDTKPREVGGIKFFIIIHLFFFLVYVRIIWQNRRTIRKSKEEYVGIGILLIVLGLINLSGAFAFLTHDDILYVSILMFTSTLCDLVTGILTIIAFFLKPQKVD